MIFANIKDIDNIETYNINTTATITLVAPPYLALSQLLPPQVHAQFMGKHYITDEDLMGLRDFNCVSRWFKGST